MRTIRHNHDPVMAASAVQMIDDTAAPATAADDTKKAGITVAGGVN